MQYYYLFLKTVKGLKVDSRCRLVVRWTAETFIVQHVKIFCDFFAQKLVFLAENDCFVNVIRTFANCFLLYYFSLDSTIQITLMKFYMKIQKTTPDKLLPMTGKGVWPSLLNHRVSNLKLVPFKLCWFVFYFELKRKSKNPSMSFSLIKDVVTLSFSFFLCSTLFLITFFDSSNDDSRQFSRQLWHLLWLVLKLEIFTHLSLSGNASTITCNECSLNASFRTLF